MGNIRKLNLIVAHTDIVSVLSEIVDLQCVEPTEPELTLDPPELTDLLRREVMELGDYDANYESITVYMTQYTYFLTGWIPAECEVELISRLSRFICAIEVTELSPAETDEAPVAIKYPQLFGKLRSGGRRLFVPLSKAFD